MSVVELAVDVPVSPATEANKFCKLAPAASSPGINLLPLALHFKTCPSAIGVDVISISFKRLTLEYSVISFALTSPAPPAVMLIFT